MSTYKESAAMAARRSDFLPRCRTYVREHKASVTAWSLFAVFVFFVYLYLSDHEFSFVLTLSSLISAFCFTMVAFKINQNRSYRGVSRKMFESYVLIQIFRCLSIVPFQGYLPYDSTGDWLYQCCEVYSLICASMIVAWGRTTYRGSYNAATDKVKLVYMIVPALVMSLIFHPSLNAFWPSDVSWTFALYLEISACLPQLIVFQQEKSVEPFTSHFLAGQVLVKLLSFLFWCRTFTELNDVGRGAKSFSGFCVLMGQGLQLLMFADYIFIYIKCLSKGVPMNLYYQDNV